MTTNQTKSKEEVLWSFPQGESEPYGRPPINRIYEAMDAYAKQEAIDFFQFNLKIIGGYLALIKAATDAADGKIVKDFMNEYEVATLEERYNMYQTYKTNNG